MKKIMQKSANTELKLLSILQSPRKQTYSTFSFSINIITQAALMHSSKTIQKLTLETLKLSSIIKPKSQTYEAFQFTPPAKAILVMVKDVETSY
jgi:hypothetical protein